MLDLPYNFPLPKVARDELIIKKDRIDKLVSSDNVQQNSRLASRLECELISINRLLDLDIFAHTYLENKSLSYEDLKNLTSVINTKRGEDDITISIINDAILEECPQIGLI